MTEIELMVTVKIEEALQKFIADPGLVHAIVEVIKERQRQVDVEGYTAKHDDEHDGGELAAAGSCYMMNAACVLHPLNGTPMEFETAKNLAGWPWEEKHWKPKDPHTDLLRGVALGIAEIMRLDRAELAAFTRDLTPIRPPSVAVGGELVGDGVTDCLAQGKDKTTP